MSRQIKSKASQENRHLFRVISLFVIMTAFFAGKITKINQSHISGEMLESMRADLN